MKKYKKVSIPRMVIDEVVCDRCADICTNTHMDIMVKYTFCDQADLFETVCWKCYEENYKPKVMKIRDEKWNAINAKGVQK